MINLKRSMASISFGLLSSFSVADNGLEGAWSLQDIKNTHTVLDRAVDKAASEMNFAIWLFNQSFLEEEKVFCKTWYLRVVKHEFHWRCDDKKVHKIPITANQTDIKEDNGQIIETSFEYTSNHISTTLKVDNITRTNVWKKISDTQMLYTAIIESANLPESLTWTLIYKKQ